MTLFTDNPFEKMMIQRPGGRRDNAPPVPHSPALRFLSVQRAAPLCGLLSETGTEEKGKRAGTLKGGFFHGT